MTVQITPATFGFFADLAADNSRAFWQANKNRMDAQVKAPFAELAAALEARFGPFKTFRMTRDTRFSPDKSPYKTMMGAVDRETGYRYLHFDRRGVLMVSGAYIFAKDQLSRYRDAVAAEPAGSALAGIIERLDRAGFDISHGGAEPLKSAPRGFDKTHPRIGLLRAKGLMASHRLPARAASLAQTTAQVIDFWTSTAPLSDWLSANT